MQGHHLHVTFYLRLFHYTRCGSANLQLLHDLSRRRNVNAYATRESGYSAIVLVNARI